MRVFVLSIFGCMVLACGQVPADTMRMAVTTSFNNSGLGEILLPEIRRDLGIDVHLLVVGTGQALGLGRRGDVDAVLVHAREAEDEFVTSGFGIRRCHVMYNDFVIIGPEDDPANIAGALDARSAFRRIAASGHDLVSRGDESGTHMRELDLWSLAGLETAGFGSWYRETGAGMGAALNTASALDAYILADRASWLSFGNQGNLDLLFSGDPALNNQYSYIRVSPDRHPHVKAELSSRLESWLTSDRAADLINGYRISGQSLFVANPGCG